MKKLLLVVACVAIVGSASAQKFSYGVKAGMNASNITKLDGEFVDADTKLKGGLYAGIFGEYTFSEYLGVQAEIMYSAQGCSFDVSGVDYLRMNLDYINVPILAKIYVLPQLSVDLGPQFGFLLSAKVKAKGDGDTAKTDIKDGMKSFDLSVPLGLSYKFDFGLEINARYALGLTKIWDDSDAPKSKNGVIQFGVGYRF